MTMAFLMSMLLVSMVVLTVIGMARLILLFCHIESLGAVCDDYLVGSDEMGLGDLQNGLCFLGCGEGWWMRGERLRVGRERLRIRHVRERNLGVHCSRCGVQL